MGGWRRGWGSPTLSGWERGWIPSTRCSPRRSQHQEGERLGNSPSNNHKQAWGAGRVWLIVRIKYCRALTKKFCPAARRGRTMGPGAGCCGLSSGAGGLGGGRQLGSPFPRRAPEAPHLLGSSVWMCPVAVWGHRSGDRPGHSAVPGSRWVPRAAGTGARPGSRDRIGAQPAAPASRPAGSDGSPGTGRGARGQRHRGLSDPVGRQPWRGAPCTGVHTPEITHPCVHSPAHIHNTPGVCPDTHVYTHTLRAHTHTCM